jgi:hypothetical protein
MTGYDKEQQDTFVEYASEHGLTPAMRKLGYPGSWATASKWCKMRGVDYSVDTLRSQAQATGQWYNDKDKLLVAQEAYRLIYETVTNSNLTTKEQKELADAGKRWIEVMNLIEGKATVVSREEQVDDTFRALIDEFNTNATNVKPHFSVPRDERK